MIEKKVQLCCHSECLMLFRITPSIIIIQTDPLEVSPDSTEPLTVTRARGSPVKSGHATPTNPEGSRLLGDTRPARNQDLLVKDGVSEVGLNLMSEEMNKLSSLLPTMWIGTQSGRSVRRFVSGFLQL